MLPENAFAKIDEHGWRLSSEKSEKLDNNTEVGLENLKRWLSENMRVVKLPELLIEIDNELKRVRLFCDDLCQQFAVVHNDPHLPDYAT